MMLVHDAMFWRLVVIVVLLPVLLEALANRIMRRRGGVGTGWTGMLMAAMAGIAGLLLILEKVRV